MYTKSHQSASHNDCFGFRVWYIPIVILLTFSLTCPFRMCPGHHYVVHLPDVFFIIFITILICFRHKLVRFDLKTTYIQVCTTIDIPTWILNNFVFMYHAVFIWFSSNTTMCSLHVSVIHLSIDFIVTLFSLLCSGKNVTGVLN